jgi:hypothetical protein
MNLGRRQFLNRSWMMAGTAFVPFFDWSSGQAKQLHSDEEHVQAKLLDMLDRSAVEILTLASRAPSGHNTQPWTIRIVDKEHWIIGIAQSRRLPAVDATGRETLLSLGTFLENVAMGAAHYGYRLEYNVVAQSPSDAEIVDLHLHKAAPAPQQLERIRLRRTVRDGYLTTGITSADLTSIIDYGPGLHYFPRASTAARYLSEGTVEANRQQAFRNPAQEELADWIRWSGTDAAKYRNGLTPAGMEIGEPIRWYVSHFYGRASVLSKSFREITINQVTERVGQGGGWLVVAGSGIGISGLIETGRAVQKMWLRLRERKIAIHPMTQMLEETPWRDQVATNLGI